MRVRRAIGLGLLVGVVGMVACVGDDPSGTASTPDAAPTASSSSGATADADLPRVDGCVPGCSADLYTSCSAAPVDCALGCAGSTGCRELDPPGSLDPTDVLRGTEDADLGGSFDAAEAAVPMVIDTDTGRIVRPADTRGQGLSEQVLRAANAVPETAELVSGIRFELRADLAVFSARNFTLRNARIVGARPVAFVATETLRVLGRVETACGQVGGFAGGVGPGQAGSGEGAGGGGRGTAAIAYSGGGGGGHGGAGGPGGAGLSGGGVVLPGAAGPARTDLVLLGGAGGGGGGRSTPAPGALQAGGAGGGVVVLVAGRSVVVGDDLTTKWFPPGLASPLDLDKGVDVSGCGGTGGGGSAASGAGGGAGGLVWVEAPSVAIRSSAGLAANGGGGGGTVGSGARGTIGDAPAAGGAGNGLRCAIAIGGTGAAGSQTAGARGTSERHTSCTDDFASGGGGGGGHVRIRTRSGGVEPFTGLVSPKPLLQLGQL